MTNNTQNPQLANAMARCASSGNWFNTVALFSLINAVIGMIGAKIHFIVGLAIAEIIADLGQGAGTPGKIISFIFVISIAGFWAFIAAQAKKGQKWAYVVGMIFYLIDGLIFLACSDFVAALFHGYVLYRLFAGFQASGEIKSLQAQQAYANPQGVWPPPPGQQTSVAPPLPGQQIAPSMPGGQPVPYYASTPAPEPPTTSPQQAWLDGSIPGVEQAAAHSVAPSSEAPTPKIEI